MELTFPLAYDFLARPPFFFSSRVSRFSSSRSFDTFSFLLVRILWYRFLLIIKGVSFFFYYFDLPVCDNVHQDNYIRVFSCLSNS